MNIKRTGITMVFAAGLMMMPQLANGETTAASTTPPTENKNLKIEILATQDLAPAVEGKSLRMRRITIGPHGVVKLHSHKGRPTVAHVMSGTVIEHRDDGSVNTHTAGDSFSLSDNVNHWEESTGRKAVVIYTGEVLDTANVNK